MRGSFWIGLGTIGPTDAALTLRFENEIKEFPIESEGWFILERYWTPGIHEEIGIDKRRLVDYRILQKLWKHKELFAR